MSRILDDFDPEDRRGGEDDLGHYTDPKKLSHGYNNPECDGDCAHCPYATC